MKRSFFIFMIFFLLAFLIAEESSSVFDEVRRQIENIHPNPYTKISKEEFEIQIEDLKKAQYGRDVMWQYFSLRQLVASLQDAHTQIVKPIENDKVLPFFVLPYGGHSIIVQVAKEYKELIGKELIAINGMKINMIFQRLLPIISHDKKEWAYLHAHYESRLFSSLKYAGAIKRDGAVSIKYKDIATGKTKSMKVMFSKNMQINNPIFANLSQTLFQSGYYRASILGNILFIQYNVCADFPDMSMKEFASRIKQLPEAKKIVVDLRHNSGGDSRVIGPLLEVLKEIIANRGTALYVFIGNATFSSGVMAATDLKEIGGLLIGEEMGWSAEFGEVKEIQLNDGFTLFCSTKDFSQNLKDVHPDIVMTQDLKDLNAGFDTLIEYIQKL